MVKINLSLNITAIKQYEEAVKKEKFKTATDVLLDNLPGVTALPELPAATYVRLYNLPGVTALPEMPAATYVLLDNLPGVTALPETSKKWSIVGKRKLKR